MTESIRVRLYENSSILLNPLEKKKYLKQWLKEIKQQIFIDILTVPILTALLIIILQIKKNDLFENIIKIISIIVLVYSICRGLWSLCYEIVGYMQGKRCCWYKSMVYIENCERGKAKGAYVIENALFEGELVSDYRRNKINYREEKYALLLYFGHHKKMILLQE
ncbi:hypothetical protein [Faecalimonas sp.]